MPAQDTGTFEQTITDRIDFQDVHPRTGSNGDFEQTLTDRIDFEDYVEAVAVAAVFPEVLFKAMFRKMDLRNR